MKKLLAILAFLVFGFAASASDKPMVALRVNNTNRTEFIPTNFLTINGVLTTNDVPTNAFIYNLNGRGTNTDLQSPTNYNGLFRPLAADAAGVSLTANSNANIGGNLTASNNVSLSGGLTNAIATADSDPSFTLQNDVQTWRLRTYGTGFDQFQLYDVLNNKIPFSICTNNATDTLVLRNGRAGFGTDNPLYGVTVEGSTAVGSSSDGLILSSTAGYGHIVGLDNTGSGYNDLWLRTTTSGTNLGLHLKAVSGFVGIATDAPTERLDVDGNAVIRSNLTVAGDVVPKASGGTLSVFTTNWQRPALEIESTDTTSEDWDCAITIRPPAHVTYGKSDAYISWLDADGSAAWLSGATAADSFIIYSANNNSHAIYVASTNHPSGGQMQINTLPGTTNGIKFSSEAGSGTGGLSIWTGGAVPKKLYSFGSTNLFFYGPDTLPTVSIGTNAEIILGQSVNEASSGKIRLVEGNDGIGSHYYTGAYLQYDGAANTFHLGTHTTSDALPANDVHRLSMLRSSGYIGIGTNTPVNTLDVSGTIGTSLAPGGTHYTGMTTNINVLIHDSTTNQLQFVNGLLVGVVPIGPP